MPSSRKMSFVVVCAAAVSFVGCSRQQEQPKLSSEPPAPAAELPPAPEPPAESGLSIKRGIAMWAQDRTTFRPCGEKAELWLLDQTDGTLTQTFTGEAQSSPAMLYIEAYGERTAVAEDIPAARTYGGTFVLEEVLYAGVQNAAQGCDTPAQNYIVAARGNEPSWAVEVGEAQMLWRQPQAPNEIVLGAPQTQDSEGAVRYRASGDGHQIELMIDAQPCRDSMSGDFFAYAAKAVLDGKEFTGCARVGK